MAGLLPPPAPMLPSVLYRSEDVDRYMNGALGDTASAVTAAGVARTVVSQDSRSLSHISPITAKGTLADFTGRIVPKEPSPQRNLLATADLAAYTSKAHFPSYLDLKTESLVSRAVPFTEPLSAQPPGASLRQKSTVRGLNTEEFHSSLLSKDKQIESLTDTVLALSNENTSLKSEAILSQERITQLVADRDLSQTTVQGLQMQLEVQSKQFIDQVAGWEQLQKETTEAHRRELENVRSGLVDAAAKIEVLTTDLGKSKQETLIAQNEFEASRHKISNLETLSQVQQQRLVEMSQTLAQISESRDVYNSQVQFRSDTRDDVLPLRDEVIVVEDVHPEMVPMSVLKQPAQDGIASANGSEYREVSPQRGGSPVGSYRNHTPVSHSQGLPHRPEDIQSMKESVMSLRQKVAQLEAQRSALYSQRKQSHHHSNQRYSLNTEYI
eukprot:TRINITY_DN2096_c1_g1_i1.p1 TRINITY_DN2096_c1_g1~~TRINITY_DN2096_c1_g1_i1.p1  ORF type:complete len:440 (+),score=92.56 TRINITY_DN2096_c1_g1_i1:209-1528(+)